MILSFYSTGVVKIPLMVFKSGAKNEIFFVSSYATNCKQMVLPIFFFFFFFFFFHDLEIIIIIFFFCLFVLIHQNLYLLIRGLFFIILLFFHTIPLQNSKLNTVLNI